MKKIIILLFIFFPYISLATSIPTISGKNAIAIETSSGRILYQKDAFTKTNIATTTKIMTAIIAVENNLLDDEIYVNADYNRLKQVLINIMKIPK